MLAVGAMLGACGSSQRMSSYGRAMAISTAQSAPPAPRAAPSQVSEERGASGDVDGLALGGSASTEADHAPAAPAAPTTPGGPASPTTTRTTATPSSPAQIDATSPAPMLIYEGRLDLRVARERFSSTIDRVIEQASAVGGYLLRRTDDSVLVRIPSARFREELRRVEGLGEVLHRSVSAEDVSETFHDLEVRLQNLRAVRARLEQFLQRAGSMAEALQVERELERVGREIDQIEGRMRFLSRRATYSLVTVSLHPLADPTMVVGPVVPPRRVLNLPVEWYQRLGIERLLHTAE
jgi:hypothetical protein